MAEQQNTLSEEDLTHPSHNKDPLSATYNKNRISNSATAHENVSNIINRRNRILNHIRREQFIITFPDTRPFLSKEHAAELLLSYHLFIKHTPEDFLFLNTQSREREFNFDEISNQVDNLIEEVMDDYFAKSNIVLDLMDLEAYKFILNKYSTILETKQPNVKKVTVPRQKAPERKRNAVITVRFDEPDYDSFKYVRAVNGKLFFRRNIE